VPVSCQAEDRTVWVCYGCWRVWIENAKAESIHNHCPLCSKWHSGARGGPAAPAQLQGDVAVAVDSAMDAEGLTGWVREAVLVRLNQDAGWMSNVSQAVHA
jgi:hypothetical protein